MQFSAVFCCSCEKSGANALGRFGKHEAGDGSADSAGALAGGEGGLLSVQRQRSDHGLPNKPVSAHLQDC